MYLALDWVDPRRAFDEKHLTEQAVSWVEEEHSEGENGRGHSTALHEEGATTTNGKDLANFVDAVETASAFSSRSASKKTWAPVEDDTTALSPDSAVVVAAAGAANTTATADGGAAASASNTVVSLASCIETFRQLEHLLAEEGNGVKCDRCNRVTSMTKQIEIWREPDVLVLHVKRFRYDAGYVQKLATSISIRPEEPLDLSPYSFCSRDHWEC